MNKGVDLGNYHDRFGASLTENYRSDIDELSGLGLILVTENRLRLTPKGMLYSNEVFQRFI